MIDVKFTDKAVIISAGVFVLILIFIADVVINGRLVKFFVFVCFICVILSIDVIVLIV